MTGNCSIVCFAIGLSVFATSAQAEWIVNPANGHEYRLTTGNYYGIHDESANDLQPDWFDAEAEAVLDGGHLVTINDQAENDWLAATFGGDEFWTGFTDWGSEGNWYWISGEPVTFTNWDSQQPDNGLGGEDCATFNHLPHRPIGTWNDLGNRTTNHPAMPFQGIIEVVPEPTTLSLLALGGLPLLRRRRSC